MSRLQVGDRITHVKYGEGVVANCADAHKGTVVGRFDYGRKLIHINPRHLRGHNPSAQAEWIAYEEKARKEYEQNLREEAERQRGRDRKWREEAERESVRAKRLTKIRNYLEDDKYNFLDAQAYYRDECSEFISEEEFNREKIKFLRAWFKQYALTNGAGAKTIPDDEQLAAIGAVDGHVQVIARAGSGKTATLVHRTIFLIEHCQVAPNEMLILAFNREAAAEIRQRLQDVLCKEGKATKQSDTALPHVMTFHALAKAIYPKENILVDKVGDLRLSRFVLQVVHDYLENPTLLEGFIRWALAHFRADGGRIAANDYDQNKQEFLHIRRSLPKLGLDGKYYKSHGEKAIANFLFEHGLEYEYEKHFRLNHGRSYYPKFTVLKTKSPETGVVIEYFEIEGSVDYDQTPKQKIKYWRRDEQKNRCMLVDITPHNIAQNSFTKIIGKCLDECGIPHARLSEHEIWNKMNKERKIIDSFSIVIKGFIGRCQNQLWSPAELNSRIAAYPLLGAVEKQFLDIAHDLYAAYLEGLATTGEVDFNMLMHEAIQSVNNGKTEFEGKSSGDLAALRYVCIDEFQDFTEQFYQLLAAIRKHNPKVELFCVGDDWQAINGFAGSDLRFFSKFDHYIDKSCRRYITTNYRSSREIVALGNALMVGLGKPAVSIKSNSRKVILADVDTLEPSAIETSQHGRNKTIPAVLRVVNKLLSGGFDIVMLSRKNKFNKKELNRFRNVIRSFFPQDIRERITTSTAHHYKGKEKSAVVILDAVAYSYPLIHPNWVYSRIFGDSLKSIVAEERRLFYVALTRAEHALVIFVGGSEKSPFLSRIESAPVIDAIDWESFPPARDSVSKRVVRIGNRGNDKSPTINIKELLKKSNYHYQPKGPAWEKVVPAAGFEVAILKSEPWTADANGIDVRIFDETEENLIEHHQIDNGCWRLVTGKTP